MMARIEDGLFAHCLFVHNSVADKFCSLVGGSPTAFSAFIVCILEAKVTLSKVKDFEYCNTWRSLGFPLSSLREFVSATPLSLLKGNGLINHHV
jgi:hypothetical protein